MKRYVANLFTFFLIALFVAFVVIAPESSDEIPNLKQPRPNIYTSGQPTPEGMTQMASHGVKSVINLRPSEEAGASDETSELQALQIKYYNIPITPDSLTIEKVEKFATLMKDPGNQLMLIHCTSANRVGALWFAYRVLYENANQTNALQEARDIGMKPSMEELVLLFVRNAHPSKKQTQ